MHSAKVKRSACVREKEAAKTRMDLCICNSPYSGTTYTFYFCAGVPKSRRGEVWLLLSHQHRLRHRLPQRQHAPDTAYHDLLKQLTAQQHAILVDLGVHAIVK